MYILRFFPEEDYAELRRNSAFKKRYAKGGDFDNELYHENEARYLQGSNAKREDILNTKFIFAEDPSLTVKLSDFRSSPPRFRPTTQKPTTTPTTTMSSTLLTAANRTSIPTQTASTLQEDAQSTSTFTTDKTTEGSTTDTTVEQGTEEDATQSSRTTEKTTGEVLFQDMEEEKPNKVQPLNFNQLKGV